MEAARAAGRFIIRRLSSGGKILAEEEKAAENVYIKKVEQEKLEKLARKGVKIEGPAALTETVTSAAADASAGVTAPPTADPRISSDKNRNYAVLAGTVTALAGYGWWYLGTKDKKTVEAHD
ncbi:uncharacterized protein At2g27730, mitochondrial-like [Wolffia australiana]